MKVPADAALGLEPFDGRIASWFARRYGAPTEIQRLAWPRIAAGEHLLISAPTGSGKTLTGFLWAIDRLATGAWESGSGVRVLYVSPLKALNADIERNLSDPLAGIGAIMRMGGIYWFAMGVYTAIVLFETLAVGALNLIPFAGRFLSAFVQSYTYLAIGCLLGLAVFKKAPELGLD